MTPIRIAGVLHGTRANGPGLRNICWVQGCSLNCPACFSPHTHDPLAGRVVDADELAQDLLSVSCGGVTISGGEPFQQVDGLARLVTTLRARGCTSILVYTGYTIGELRARPRQRNELCFATDIIGLAGRPGLVDILVAGRYAKAHPEGWGLRSSTNQFVHFLSDAHDPEELNHPNGVEVHLVAGRQIVTGFPDAMLLEDLA